MLEQVWALRDDYEEEDGEGNLDDAVVRDFHFGGGFVPKQQSRETTGAEAGDEEAPERRRTKREVSTSAETPLFSISEYINFMRFQGPLAAAKRSHIPCSICLYAFPHAMLWRCNSDNAGV